MRGSFRPGRALLVPLLALSLGGCGTLSSFAPPDWAYFDVVRYPGGGVPATLGYYAGVAVWTPFGFLLGAVVPYPADETVARTPGHALGTGTGLLLGAPFHLVSLPFRGGEPPPVEEKGVPPEPRPPAGDAPPVPPDGE